MSAASKEVCSRLVILPTSIHCCLLANDSRFSFSTSRRCVNRIRSLSLFPPVTNVPPMPKFSSSTTIAEKLMYIIAKVDWITRMNMMLVNSSHTLQTQQVWRLQESLRLHCHARFFPKHMRLPLPKVQSHLLISASFCLSLVSHRSGSHSSECSKTSSCRCRHQAKPLIRTPPGIPS
jgi:hypothetical protein